MNCRSRWWFLGDLEINIRRKGNTGFHVAMSQRHDVDLSRCLVNRRKSTSDPTSRRHHDFCTSIIKSKGRPNFEGIEEHTEESTESRAATTRIIGEDTSFCISSFLQTKLLIISRLIVYIQVQYVLDSHLGFC